MNLIQYQLSGVRTDLNKFFKLPFFSRSTRLRRKLRTKGCVIYPTRQRKIEQAAWSHVPRHHANEAGDYNNEGHILIKEKYPYAAYSHKDIQK